ncbi:MAG: hypothetical protein FJ271_08900 [Planctomycetes bacterium]|nr:hypothetical protein [Planctomycetota bacterium]
MEEIVVEQGLFERVDRQAPRLLARSPSFQEEWQLDAESMILSFGDRPPGVRCPLAVFAYPLGNEHVTIARVADRLDGENSANGKPTSLFLFQVLPRDAYTHLFGDPFALAARLPQTWAAAGELPVCRLPAEPLPPRTVEEVRQVLRRIKGKPLSEDREPVEAEALTIDNAESPALLGGVQVLVDGGRLAFERPSAETGLIPALWLLLPYSTRNQLWPASFAFGNALGFDALVVPRAIGSEYNGYTSEEQAAVYPEGRYELNLQIAVESGDQRQLDALFERRSWLETWRLALTLLVGFTVLAILSRVLL